MTREQIQQMGYRTNGDCFEVAANTLVEDKSLPEGACLVHGLVSHSEIPGLRYSHAWVEFEQPLPNSSHKIRVVRDTANGNEVTLPADIYYLLGKINPNDGQEVYRYSRKQTCQKLSESGHYGPWDLESEL